MSARQLKAFAHATMNLDLHELIDAGVIDATCTQGNSGLMYQAHQGAGGE